MTSPSGLAGGAPAGPPPDADRFGVRCPRCGRTQDAGRQPAVRQWPYCQYCSAPLLVATWVAVPPPGAGSAPRVVRMDPPYAGPPRYGPYHPGWGFPPVARLHAPASEPGAGEPDDGRPAGRWLSAAIVLLLSAGLTCAAAAAAETWRFVLLLRGRTVVLPAVTVRASDAAVLVTGVAAGLLGTLSMLAAAAAARALYHTVTVAHGLLAARSGASITARLLVPGWNLYGVGQILVELLGLVFRPGRGGRAAPRPVRRLLVACWACWAVNGLVGLCLVALQFVVALPGRFGDSQQVAANLVQAHIALDVIAAITAVLFAVQFAVLRREWWGEPAAMRARWTVAPPVATPRNRQGPAPRSAEPAAARSTDAGADAG